MTEEISAPVQALVDTDLVGGRVDPHHGTAGVQALPEAAGTSSHGVVVVSLTDGVVVVHLSLQLRPSIMSSSYIVTSVVVVMVVIFVIFWLSCSRCCCCSC